MEQFVKIECNSPRDEAAAAAVRRWERDCAVEAEAGSRVEWMGDMTPLAL